MQVATGDLRVCNIAGLYGQFHLSKFHYTPLLLVYMSSVYLSVTFNGKNQVFQEKTVRFYLFFMQVLWLCRRGSKLVVAFTARINTLAFSEKGKQ